MTVLTDYNHFSGLHWETGTIANYFAYRGVNAPHTNEPISEALLLGVSGGVVMGYFTFAYEGYDPQCNILTRNTFDPWDTMLSRLGVVQNIEHTSKADKAVTILKETLADGIPAIVWADMWNMPYNALPFDDGMWAMFPIVVYGYDEAADEVFAADRAQVPLKVTTAELAAARARVKKDKHRLMTLEAPNWDKLSSAVRMGICDTIKLYTEKPPKGSKNNFGFLAYQHWAKLLTNPKQRMSWEKEFPAGRKMFAGLLTALDYGVAAGGRDRNLYADFLEEAAVILEKPQLQEAAPIFRESAEAWDTLGRVLLPQEIAPFGEAYQLKMRERQLFHEQGGASTEERADIRARLDELKEVMARDFPLDEAGVVAHRERIAAQVMKIHDIEMRGIELLDAAMG